MASKFTSDAFLGETPDFNLRFPPLPKTLEEVSKLISEHAELPDTPRLADIVGADPIVAAFVLRRVNSVHHSVRRSVDDVRKAVRLLGYQEVVNIALAVGMMQLEEFMATEERSAIFQDTITAVIRNYLRPGALKDRSLRGLALSVAVSASEQVCLSM